MKIVVLFLVGAYLLIAAYGEKRMLADLGDVPATAEHLLLLGNYLATTIGVWATIILIWIAGE